MLELDFHNLDIFDLDEKRQHSPDSMIEQSNPNSKKAKLCLVCGDKALGYNFNAISCESCKAFFRRNAHKTIRGRCEGRCDINIESRSFCKRCRLAKCFTVGMRKDMILDESQKKLRKQKILINKLRRHGNMLPEEKYAISDDDVKMTIPQISMESMETLRECYPHLSEKDLKTLCDKDVEKSPTTRNKKTDNTEKYPSYMPWSEIKNSLLDIVADMDTEEKELLIEMNNAHQSSAFLSTTTTKLKQLPSTPTDMFNIADGFVRKIIKVAKQLSYFRAIDKDDQIALLKGSVVEIMMLRSAVNFDVKTETWSLSTNNCLKETPSMSSDSSTASVSSPMSAEPQAKPFDFPQEGKGLDFSKLREAAMKGADLNQLREMASQGGADLSKLREMASQGGADLSKLREMASQGGADLSKLREMASQGGGDLSKLREMASQGGADLSKLREMASQGGGDLSKLREMAQSGSSCQTMDIDGQAATCTSSTAPVNELQAPDTSSPSGSVDPEVASLASLRNDAKAAGFDINALRKAAMNGASLEELSRMAHGEAAPSDGDDDATQSNSINSNILKKSNQETRTLFFMYSKFIRSLMLTIQGDLVVLKFLIMLSLFSPDRQGLENRKVVEDYQELYARSLQKYLCVRFPCEKNMFARCIMQLTDLRNVNEVHTKMLLRMDVQNIEPLLVEIFDLPL